MATHTCMPQLKNIRSGLPKIMGTSQVLLVGVLGNMRKSWDVCNTIFGRLLYHFWSSRGDFWE